MPPIEAALGHLIVVVVIIMQEGIVMGIVRIAQKRRTEGIFHCAAVFLRCKAPCPAEVILGSGPADGRVFLIPVNIELHFPFSVPVPLQGG